MSTFSRRSFLARSAAAGASASVLGAATSRGATKVPLTRSEERVVVIGSGFGGGVSALRLAQAGVPVLVLERGKRWPTGPNADTFPSINGIDKRMLWYGSNPNLYGKTYLLPKYAGLLDAVAGDNMVALCAAGVGGGSLVYQGMTLQPSADVFNRVLPEQLDYARMSREHYPRVARMLKVAGAPDELIASVPYKAPRIFKRNAERAGYGVEKIPMPIDWNFALAELRGEMKASYTNSAGSLGVNNGGKQTVDVTYLQQAELTGRVTVAPLHHVTGISRNPAGKWVIAVDHTDVNGRLIEQKLITAKSLIMAAGSLNTTKLLMTAAGRGDITDLPDELGQGWGTNADRIYVWENFADDFGPKQGGPVVYGSKEWGDPALANTVIQASLPELGPLTHHSTMLVGFGVSEARGKFIYDAKKDQALLRWPKDGDKAVHAQIARRVKKIAGPWSALIDTNTIMPSTWHPLGGACMGTVCDLEGRVRGQRGLYVLDGALIPGSTAACNPSMTIAAVAERAMDEIVRDDVGTII
ncbi:MAG: GMC oxidoreductase [Solirubrobacteraceae bacterium]|nr:GMC oxidoreductase [Solirubrobacteraceae bacterium]